MDYLRFLMSALTVSTIEKEDIPLLKKINGGGFFRDSTSALNTCSVNVNGTNSPAILHRLDIIKKHVSILRKLINNDDYDGLDRFLNDVKNGSDRAILD